MTTLTQSEPAGGARDIRATAERESGGFFAHHGLWAPGVRLFRRLGFMAKAIIISLAFVVPLLSMLVWQARSEAGNVMQARMDATRQHVEIAHGVIAAAHAGEVAGRLSRTEAQRLARETLARLRFDQQEYFWINDMQPRMVMHPIKPELDGKELGGLKDPNGFALFTAFVDTVRASGEGFVAYQWPKPGRDAPVDKISYVKGFTPWGWIVGSGIWVGDIHDALRARLVWLAAMAGASLCLAGYLFLAFYRVMDGGLKETRRHLRAITDGDLTTSPSPWGRDEAAQLMLDLRAMQDALRRMVAGVRLSSDGIVHSSNEIAQAATDLSGRTEQTAASLQQAAQATEQIGAAIRSTSDNANEAAEVARRNEAVAADGGQAMQQVVTTMEAIGRSSKRIEDIIGTIDGIAFQTNLLALNAAVEAARAGEHGRGFAVVAAEVRALASRSAVAAREIGALIGTTVREVGAGVQAVRAAGGTIGEVVTSSRRVNELLIDIATAAREQTSGIGQIEQTVQEVDRSTQQNAAMVEQTAAASDAMRDQATRLAQDVARFVLPA